MNESIKNHIKCVWKVIYCYLLGIVLSWAAYPLLIFLITWDISINKSQTVYSIFATLVWAAVTYISMHEFGVNDRKPYKWVKYRGKGFVCGSIAAVAVNLIGYLTIFIADKVLYIQHPFANISTLNSYMRLIIYMPFFWFFEFINSSYVFMPKVTYLSALITVPFIILVSGLGYMAGFMNITIIRSNNGSDILSKILYKQGE